MALPPVLTPFSDFWRALGKRAHPIQAEEMNAAHSPDKVNPPSTDDRPGQFLSRASHDLRAPVRHIRALAEWLAEDHGEELSVGAQEMLAGIERCAARLETLIGDMIEYLRLDAEVPAQGMIDAGQLVAEAIARIDPPAGVTVTVEGELPAIPGSPERLARLFSALVDNAVRHHDSAAGRIVISGSASAGDCVFRVQDDGPGIAPEFREAVFEPFRALSPRDEAAGSGMGLAIARRIVAQHGGRIWIEDNPGRRGACVAFTVPRRADVIGSSPPADEIGGREQT
jgi:signal transduction histidine kinase